MKINGVENNIKSKNLRSDGIGREVYNEFVFINPRPFSFGELQLEILKRGGVPLYDVGYTIGKKVRDAEEEGELVYVAKENKFYPKSLVGSNQIF